jgi:hypothetical protein
MATQEDNNGDGRGQTGAEFDWAAFRAFIKMASFIGDGNVHAKMIVESILLAETAEQCMAFIDAVADAEERVCRIIYDDDGNWKPGFEA